MSSFTLGDIDVQPGQRATVDLPVSVLSNHTHVALPVHVVHGEEKGPVIFLSGAIHGDEIQGVEIIRRILTHPFADEAHAAPYWPCPSSTASAF